MDSAAVERERLAVVGGARRERAAGHSLDVILQYIRDQMLVVASDAFGSDGDPWLDAERREIIARLGID